MKLNPVNSKVAIKRNKMEDKSEGGIILPGNENKRSHYGEVVGVGPGGKDLDGTRHEMSVKVGDTVFFTDDFHVTVPETGIVIVDDDDILGIVVE